MRPDQLSHAAFDRIDDILREADVRHQLRAVQDQSTPTLQTPQQGLLRNLKIRVSLFFDSLHSFH